MVLYKQGILIAFGELFLKSKGVKKLFQNRLINNLALSLKKQGISPKIRDFRDRIFIQAAPRSKAINILKQVFGISWLAQAWFFENNDLKQAQEFIKDNYEKWLKPNQTFALALARDKQAIKQNREQIIEKIAKNINRKVNLDKPSKTIFIEAKKAGWFIYLKKQKGAGGLPVGVEGKVLSLMSGGIDSPVASYLIAKRGAENIWLHFHSFPLTSNKSIEKVKEISKIFLNFQPKLKVYFIPFGNIQTAIKTKAPAKHRILLYRRFMLKIAEKIAEKENCQALVTGESLGQVSSQTLYNLAITNQAVKIPILRPLIGMDKLEIISLAKKINTYHISIQPQEDCCTLFTPKHPTAKGDIAQIRQLEKELEKELEKKLNLAKLITQTLKETEKIYY